jgi:hypothetical protein
MIDASSGRRATAFDLRRASRVALGNTHPITACPAEVEMS